MLDTEVLDKTEDFPLILCGRAGRQAAARVQELHRCPAGREAIGETDCEYYRIERDGQWPVLCSVQHGEVCSVHYCVVYGIEKCVVCSVQFAV